MKWLWTFVLLSMIGCIGSNELTEQDLMVYVLEPENGLTGTRQESGYTISLTVRPSDFIARQQMKSGGKREYDSLCAVYSRYNYFIMDISKDGNDLETLFALKGEDFASRISFLSSAFTAKIKGVSANKEYDVADYVYIRSYGNGPSRFLLAFEKTEGDLEINIDGYDLGFGRVKFLFVRSQLMSIPKLKL